MICVRLLVVLVCCVGYGMSTLYYFDIWPLDSSPYNIPEKKLNNFLNNVNKDKTLKNQTERLNSFLSNNIKNVTALKKAKEIYTKHLYQLDMLSTYHEYILGDLKRSKVISTTTFKKVKKLLAECDKQNFHEVTLCELSFYGDLSKVPSKAMPKIKTVVDKSVAQLKVDKPGLYSNITSYFDPPSFG